MGQSHSNQESTFSNSVKKRSEIQLEQENWTLLEKPEVDKEEMGNFGIYRNEVTGEVARRYELILESRKKIQEYIEEFDYWRSELTWNVIESKYIIFEEENLGFSQLLCGKYFPVKIFVENPVVTLAEIKDIPIPEGFLIILSSLLGFEKLFEIFGYFALTESMVTINEHGIAKVWIHPNLSSNRPFPIGLNEISETDIECPNRFIRELIEMIDNNIDYGEIDVKFSNYINKKYQNKRSLSFSSCRKHLLNYAQELRIDLPDSLLSILDLLFDKTNRTEISEQNLSQNNQNNGPAVYGNNYENKYLLGEDSENDHYQNFNTLENVQSPSENSQIPHRSPSDEIGSFYPQDNQNLRIRISTEEISAPSENSNAKNLSRNYSYNVPKIVSNEVDPIYKNQNHRKSFPVQNFSQQENGVSQSENAEDFIENPYHSLVERENVEKQSTIREEIEEDSFLTSYKNGKFQSSKEMKRPSNHFKKHNKNIQTHRHTYSSQSDSRIKTQNIENISPRQIKIREENEKQIDINPSQPSMSKKSQKSIQFHTLYEVKELDAEIAEDLEKMLNREKK